MRRKRLFSRADIEVRVEALPKGGETLTGSSTNLSVKGVFIDCDPSVKTGTEVSLEIHLPEEAGGGSLKMNGKVARIHDEGVAVAFTEVEIEEMERLIEVVRAHFPDPGEFDEEFRDGYKNRDEG